MFTADLENLLFDTIYNFRAFGILGERIFYGNTLSSRTTLLQLTVENSSINDYQSVNIVGSILGLGQKVNELSDHGLCWSSTETYTTLELRDSLISLGAKKSNGIFEELISDLEPDITYYFRSYAIDKESDKVFYSDPLTFTINDVWVPRSSLGKDVADTSGSSFSLSPRRHKAIAFPYGDNIYVGTGVFFFLNREKFEDIGFRNDFYKYSPTLDTWTRVDSFAWASRVECTSFKINNEVYVGLGSRIDTEDPFAPPTLLYNDFKVFDGDSWQDGGIFPGLSRTGTISFVQNGKAYIGLGKDEFGNNVPEIWQFDPNESLGNQWELFTVVGEELALDNAVSIVANKKVYIGLGKTSTSFKKSFYQFDVGSKQWISIQSFPGLPRSSAIAFVLEGRLYVGSGEGGGRTGQEGITSNFNDFFEYDPESNAWKEITALRGQVRDEAVAVSLDNRAFVGTGLSTFGQTGLQFGLSQDDWYEYIPERKN